MKIGQEVVCIRGVINSVTQEKLIEGKIYTIMDVSHCNCSDLVDVGFKSNPGSMCYSCNKQMPEHIWWLYSNRFVPLDDIDISKVYEILESNQINDVR